MIKKGFTGKVAKRPSEMTERRVWRSGGKSDTGGEIIGEKSQNANVPSEFEE